VYAESCPSVPRHDLRQPEHRQVKCKIPARLTSLRTSPCHSSRIEFNAPTFHQPLAWGSNIGQQTAQDSSDVHFPFQSVMPASPQNQARQPNAPVSHCSWCALNLIVGCNSTPAKSEIDISGPLGCVNNRVGFRDFTLDSQDQGREIKQARRLGRCLGPPCEV